MKRIALAAATLAAVICAASASPAGPTLYPHIYSVKIAGSQIGLLNATWRISIQRTVFGLQRNGGTAAVGSMKIAGNRITFHDLGGPLACRGAQINGTYTWRLAGAKLTLTRVADSCIGRRGVLAHALTRVA
jgi:hypothetical protein